MKEQTAAEGQPDAQRAHGSDHSPLPWHHDSYTKSGAHYSIAIRDANKLWVASADLLYPINEDLSGLHANAALIVEAVNSYSALLVQRDALLEALKMVHAYTLRGECCPVCSQYPHHQLCALTAVIAEAR